MFAYRAAWSQLASARACCPVGVPRLNQHKRHGWTTAVNVKRLLPPRQSRGNHNQRATPLHRRLDNFTAHMQAVPDSLAG
jgi:hypothetical protein